MRLAVALLRRVLLLGRLLLPLLRRSLTPLLLRQLRHLAPLLGRLRVMLAPLR